MSRLPWASPWTDAAAVEFAREVRGQLLPILAGHAKADEAVVHVTQKLREIYSARGLVHDYSVSTDGDGVVRVELNRPTTLAEAREFQQLLGRLSVRDAGEEPS